MAPRAIPDRWLAYKACGDIIEGTRIICFKVPLRKAVQEKEPTLTEIWDIPSLLARIPKLSAVIDLTNTDRYYDPNDFRNANVLHKKILMPGRVLPPERKVKEFMDTVDEFLGVNCDALIGIHCTHGLNRTGYMVCRYMRDRLGIPGREALSKFETARGYKVERPVYINDIFKTEKAQDKGKAPREEQNRSRNKPNEMISETQSEQSSGFSNVDHKESPFNNYVSHNERSYFQRNSDVRLPSTNSDRETRSSNNFRDRKNFNAQDRHNYSSRNNCEDTPNYSDPRDRSGHRDRSHPRDRSGPTSYSGPSNRHGPNSYSGASNRNYPTNYNGPKNYSEPNKFSGLSNDRGTNQRNYNDRHSSGGSRYNNDEKPNQHGRNYENNWRNTRDDNQSSPYSRTWRNSSYGDRRPRNDTDHHRFDESDNC